MIEMIIYLFQIVILHSYIFYTVTKPKDKAPKSHNPRISHCKPKKFNHLLLQTEPCGPLKIHRFPIDIYW